MKIIYRINKTRLVQWCGLNSSDSCLGQSEWGSKALENDLEIKSVTFSTELGELPSDEYYLPAGENVDISVDIGFEGLSDRESFAEGDARVCCLKAAMKLSIRHPWMLICGIIPILCHLPTAS